MCHLVAGQSVIYHLCRESSALQKVVHDWHNQKCRDSQTQKAELLALPVGGFFLSTAGRAWTAYASQQMDQKQ